MEGSTFAGLECIQADCPDNGSDKWDGAEATAARLKKPLSKSVLTPKTCAFMSGLLNLYRKEYSPPDISLDQPD
jgi:hypothetical protein